MMSGAEPTGGYGLRGDRLQTLVRYFRENRRARLALIVGPPLSVLLVFFVFPMGTMLWMSFLTDLPPAPYTLQHYVRLVSSTLYLRVVIETAILTVQTTVLVTVLGYTLAYSIVRLSKWTSILLLLVILPFWTNYIIRMYAWINILQSGGVIDFFLTSLNLVQQANGHLYTTEAVLVGFVYVWLPLATLPFYSSITGMDQDLIDAAKDLGSGPLKTFVTVTYPQTRDGIVAGIILSAIPTFGSFITPTLLGGTNVIMIGVVIENQFTSAFNWPFGSALSMVVSAVVLLFLIAGVMTGSNLVGGETS
jgi:spermidine/putrescine transport system permease protein